MSIMTTWLLSGVLATPSVCALQRDLRIQDRVIRHSEATVLVSAPILFSNGSNLRQHPLALACVKGRDVTKDVLHCVSAKDKKTVSCKQNLEPGTAEILVKLKAGPKGETQLKGKKKRSRSLRSLSLRTHALGGAVIRVVKSCVVKTEEGRCVPELTATTEAGEALKQVRWAMGLSAANNGLWSKGIPLLRPGRHRLLVQGRDGQGKLVSALSPPFEVAGHLFSVGSVEGIRAKDGLRLRKELLAALSARTYLDLQDPEGDERRARTSVKYTTCIDDTQDVPALGRVCIKIRKRRRRILSAQVRILRRDGNLEILPPVKKRRRKKLAPALAKQLAAYFEKRHRQGLKEGQTAVMDGAYATARLRLETDTAGATVEINGTPARPIKLSRKGSEQLRLETWQLLVKAPGKRDQQINLSPALNDEIHLKVRFKTAKHTKMTVNCTVENTRQSVVVLIDGHAKHYELQSEKKTDLTMTMGQIQTASGQKSLWFHRSDGARQQVTAEIEYGGHADVQCDPKKWSKGVVYLRTDAPIDLSFCVDSRLCAPASGTGSQTKNPMRILYGGTRARVQRLEGLKPGPHFLYVQLLNPYRVAVIPFRSPAKQIIEVPWALVNKAYRAPSDSPIVALPPRPKSRWATWTAAALATAGAGTLGFGYGQQLQADDAEDQRRQILQERGRDDAGFAGDRQSALKNRNILYIASGTLLAGAITLAIHAMTDGE